MEVGCARHFSCVSLLVRHFSAMSAALERSASIRMNVLLFSPGRTCNTNSVQPDSALVLQGINLQECACIALPNNVGAIFPPQA